MPAGPAPQDAAPARRSFPVSAAPRSPAARPISCPARGSCHRLAEALGHLRTSACPPPRQVTISTVPRARICRLCLCASQTCSRRPGVCPANDAPLAGRQDSLLHLQRSGGDATPPAATVLASAAIGAHRRQHRRSARAISHPLPPRPILCMPHRGNPSSRLRPRHFIACHLKVSAPLVGCRHRFTGSLPVGKGQIHPRIRIDRRHLNYPRPVPAAHAPAHRHLPPRATGELSSGSAPKARDRARPPPPGADPGGVRI